MSQIWARLGVGVCVSSPSNSLSTNSAVSLSRRRKGFTDMKGKGRNGYNQINRFGPCALWFVRFSFELWLMAD